MLELVIAELRAGDYHSRMPDAAAKKRIENKYFELVGEKICWDPEITNKIGYLRKLWSINGQLIKRTGVAVDQSTGQIDMMQTWNMETKDKRLGSRQSIDEVLQQQNSTLKRLLRGSCCLQSFLKRAFDALKNLTVNLVLTAHPTQSNHWSLPQKFGRSVYLFLSVYA
ncbi:hypothetical protein HID58_047259 [Brassica napus]|uniref:Phosphoenolpyruvate carboxylase n=1 Tax=Brassica napus TaxID=3708 RepID=A0ABQ8AYP3_BRANA|nr:hypothetical protein HID58_047259 [Brassica napus]